MKKRLQLTAFDIQNGDRIREVVLGTLAQAADERDWVAGPKMEREMKRIGSDLLGSLKRMGVRNAEAEAEAIMADVAIAFAQAIFKVTGEPRV
jgi:hypothetical protein